MAKTTPEPAAAEKHNYPFKSGEGNLGVFRAKSPRVNENLGKLSLTEKQSKVYHFILEHVEKLGFPPTVRQIASYFNVSAKAAHDHLKAVARKGYIRLFAGAARGIEIIQESDSDETAPLFDLLQEVNMVPLVGSIAAGAPILAQENIETKLAFPKSFLPETGSMFALRVKGDSMEGAGIMDGDIAVLRQVHDISSEVKNGDIVAALIDGDATLKTWSKKGANIELLPENSRYQPIKLDARDNASIVGKLVGVYRTYR